MPDTQGEYPSRQEVLEAIWYQAPPGSVIVIHIHGAQDTQAHDLDTRCWCQPAVVVTPGMQ